MKLNNVCRTIGGRSSEIVGKRQQSDGKQVCMCSSEATIRQTCWAPGRPRLLDGVKLMWFLIPERQTPSALRRWRPGSKSLTARQAERASITYTAANGGKLYNLGQQHIPVSLDNGCRTVATFQIAEVSRPLMSVSKVCEMGNRVIFGAGGGYIMNIETGATTKFETKDGIYIFKLWIPPLSESPFGGPQ